MDNGLGMFGLTAAFMIVLFFGLPAFAIVSLMRGKVKKEVKNVSTQNFLTKPRSPFVIVALFTVFAIFFSYFFLFAAVTYTGN